MFDVHKPGQAKLTRMVSVLGGIFAVVWGCRALLYALPGVWRPLGLAWNEILRDARPEDAWRVDLALVESAFSPALTASVVLLVAGSLWWFWLMNRPRIADQLIEMETELQKVSWPAFPDAWQSTLVVSGFTALMVVLIFGYDIVIRHFIELMPAGGI